jgi:hypothetical protein
LSLGTRRRKTGVLNRMYEPAGARPEGTYEEAKTHLP